MIPWARRSRDSLLYTREPACGDGGLWNADSKKAPQGGAFFRREWETRGRSPSLTG